jgi:hypothetical protein
MYFCEIEQGQRGRQAWYSGGGGMEETDVKNGK